MKELDVVKLTNVDDNAQRLNLCLGFHGIILSIAQDKSKVLFFNDYNIGEATVCEVLNTDIVREGIDLPANVGKLIDAYMQQGNNLLNKKLSSPAFRAGDCVEVLVDKRKYSKHNIHKGDRGFVVLGDVINNEILVDFTEVNIAGELVGEEISIDICDLRLINE